MRPTQKQVQLATSNSLARRFLVALGIQRGPNPLSIEEINYLSQKHPDRWGAIADSLKLSMR